MTFKEVTHDQFYEAIGTLDVVTRSMSKTVVEFEIRGGMLVGYRTPGWHPGLGPKRYRLTEQFIDKHAPHLKET